MTGHTPTPWMTHRAGEMLPDDWMIMADLGHNSQGIQQVSTVARALSIRQTPETTAANAAFIVKAVNNHDALVEALEDLISDAERQMRNPSHHLPFSLQKARDLLAAVSGGKQP